MKVLRLTVGVRIVKLSFPLVWSSIQFTCQSKQTFSFTPVSCFIPDIEKDEDPYIFSTCSALPWTTGGLRSFIKRLGGSWKSPVVWSGANLVRLLIHPTTAGRNNNTEKYKSLAYNEEFHGSYFEDRSVCSRYFFSLSKLNSKTHGWNLLYFTAFKARCLGLLRSAAGCLVWFFYFHYLAEIFP